MSRLSDYPGGNDEDDDIVGEDPADGGRIMDVVWGDCSGSDFEMQWMLKEIKERLGKQEFAFWTRFEKERLTAVRISFMDEDKVRISTKQMDKNGFVRHYMVFLNEKVPVSTRTFVSVPEIGIVRVLLLLLRETGN